MDYDEILPSLYVGSFPKDAADVDRLKDELGVTAVLSLQTTDDRQRLGIDWQPMLVHYGLSGIEVRSIPVRDFDEDDLCEKLPDCVEALSKLLESGYRVFVHCTAGTGRSPSVVIAYLHWKKGRPLDEAERFVQPRRSIVPNMQAIRRARKVGGRG